MRLINSSLDLGFKDVMELDSVGQESYYGKNSFDPLKRSMDQVLKDIIAETKCSVIVASLTTKQVGGAKCLLDNGFKKIGRGRRNPNSGNNICLFVKFLKGKK